MELTLRIQNTERFLQADIRRIEGELLEVVCDDKDMFRVGEPVLCSLRDVQFESRVLRVRQGVMYLFFPFIRDQKYLVKLRREPRVKVQLNASLMNGDTKEKIFRIAPVTLHDVSILGVGFTSDKLFAIGEHFTILPQSDQLPIKVELEIKNRREDANGYRYGAEITHITSNHFQVLRRYVLTQQLAADGERTSIPHAP